MQDLKALVNLVNKQRVKNIVVIGNPGSRNNKLNKLYEGIHIGKFTTDEEAAQALYNTDPNNTNYKKLKYRLEDRLINTLFFLDLTKIGGSAYAQAEIKVSKNLHTILIMIQSGLRKVAIPIALKSFRLAIKYELTIYCIRLAKILRSHYANIGNHNQFKFYNNIVNKYVALQHAELKAEEYYYAINVHSMRLKSTKEAVAAQALIYEKELRGIFKKTQSNTLCIFAFNLFCVRAEYEGDFQGMVEASKEAIQYLESKKKETATQVFSFYLKMLLAYLQLKKYQKGEVTAEKCIQILESRGLGKSINMSVVFMTYVNLCFHTKNYSKALENYSRANQKNMHKPPFVKETFQLYQAFIHFFIQIGKITPDPSKAINLEKFRISKFLNEVPEFSTSKRRFNIPILIIQVLFLLHQKNYDKIIDKVEALNAYAYRYLKKDNTFRSNCFIKILVRLPKANFHPEGLKRHASKYYNKLLATPINTAQQSLIVEIVPYEHLWDIILEILARNLKKF